jgi:hypothetical protein
MNLRELFGTRREIPAGKRLVLPLADFCGHYFF